MKTSQRHHLKHNELAIVLGHVNEWTTRNRRSITAIVAVVVVIAIAVSAFFIWRSSVENTSREALAQAMVVLESRVAPPIPASEPGKTPQQQTGTYPTEKAKLEAALPKFLAAADAHPSTDAGQTARYQAAAILVSLGRFDEGIKQYERLEGASGLLGKTSRLGKAEAQLRAGQHDAAIASFKDLSEKSDSEIPKEAILLELARAYHAAGKTDDARKTLNQIVEQHADSPFAATAKQELEKIKG